MGDGATESVEAPITDLGCDRVRRRIEVGAWGTIYVHDEFHVSNPTSIPVDSVTLSLPLDSQNVTGSDVGGPIEVFLPSRSEELPPRAIVYFRLVLKENESYTFTVHFKIPGSRNIELLDFDSYRLEFPIVPGLGTSISTLHVEVVLPEGANLEEKDSSPLPLKIEQDALQQIVVFKVEDARFEESRRLILEYRYLIVWSAFRPTLWVGLALGTLYATRRILRVGRFEAQEVSIPKDLIHSFVDAMDEKISLQAELASLEARVESGTLSKRRYRGRSRTISRQLSSLNKELNGLKEELKISGEKYLEAVKRTEVAEVDLETNIKNLDSLESRYRSGRISRSVYDRLRHEYQNRMRAARTEINRVIIELREDIR